MSCALSILTYIIDCFEHFCVQNGIFETDYAAYQRTTHADYPHSTFTEFPLAKQYVLIKGKGGTERAVLMEVDLDAFSTTWYICVAWFAILSQ